MEKTTLKWLKIGNLVSFLAVVIINVLANVLPINGKLTQDISDSIPNLFVPAGITFAIWGLIYLALGAFSIYQFSSDDEVDRTIEQIGPWFLIGSLANFVWILFWHYELIAWSLVMTLVILVSLVFTYLRLNIGKNQNSAKKRFFADLTFSIYLGWASVATVANVTALLVVEGWNGFGIAPEIWTMLILGVVTTLGILMLAGRKDIAYVGVLIWAFIGIILKRTEATVAQPGIVLVATLGAVILGLYALIQITQSLLQYRHHQTQTHQVEKAVSVN